MSDISKRDIDIKKYFSEYKEEMDLDTVTFQGNLTAKGCKLTYEELKKVILGKRIGADFRMRLDVNYIESTSLEKTAIFGHLKGMYCISYYDIQYCGG
jgi:hypothetical protein|nr:MAG TPA: hypothetical protein [Caudoviricetes sp.]